MKILGGVFKGRLLSTPKSDTTRPTLAVMRQAVFNILQDSIEGAHVLDLYAGSGAMGLEALSRGASHVTFVETNPEACRCIKSNIETLNVAPQCKLLRYDVFLALKKLRPTFDLIYADPPYANDTLLSKLLLLLDTHPLLHPSGTLFLEEADPSSLQIPPLTSLAYLNHRRFSRSLLHQFLQT
jgi:16S rRNA (guanine(966)-N(2))-methyltransferase RsmD